MVGGLANYGMGSAGYGEPLRGWPTGPAPTAQIFARAQKPALYAARRGQVVCGVALVHLKVEGESTPTPVFYAGTF